MRAASLRWLGGSGLLCLVSITLGFAAAADAPNSSSDSESAEQLVQLALHAEASGNTSGRTENLELALKRDPDHAAVHWHLGHVRVDEEWLPVDTAIAATKESGKIEEYRKRRDTSSLTEASQLRVARWCAGQGLAEEERIHLMAALGINPRSKEAIRKLDLVPYGGRLVQRDELEATLERRKESAASLKRWKPRIDRLVRDATGSNDDRRTAALDELKSIDDPAAIPALERESSVGPPEIGEAVVAVLSEMREQAAIDSLLRHAVLSSHETVREAAIESLQTRSMFSYVPTLMGALREPVEVRYESRVINGQAVHRLSMFEEGPFADRSLVSMDGSTKRNIIVEPNGVTYPGSIVPDRTANRDRQIAMNTVRMNRVREATNERISAVLRAASGISTEMSPKGWWDWWIEYNDLYRTEEKPVDSQYYDRTPAPVTGRVIYRQYEETPRNPVPQETVRTPTRPSQPPTILNDRRYIRETPPECFVAGTKVWTSGGTLPIEQIRIGDCVLAQDIATGELAFKPVIATSVRPTGPVMEVRTAGAAIRSTQGHPFWVSGAGWQRAKDLSEGGYLHTPTGPIEIVGVEGVEEAVCYNIEVAEFNTYFVSDDRVLVHDNEVRDVTPTTVPGLVQP